MLLRRSPLVILLCLELMLNAGNLALLAFSRSLGNEDGQVFALIVMVVAACEVVVGLGLIVAAYRRRIPLNVDELRELRGDERDHLGWLVLAFPLAGSMVIAFGYRVLPGPQRRLDRDRRDRARLRSSIGTLFALLDQPGRGAPAHRLALRLRHRPPARHPAERPGRPALGLHVPGGQRDLDPDPPLLGLLHGLGPGYARFFSYLNFFVFSMLLLVLAGNLVLLIVGWAFVGFASYALISFWYRRDTATKAGMKAFVINVVGDIGLVLAALFLFRELGTFDLLEIFEAARETFTTNEGVVVAICLLLWSAPSPSPPRSRSTPGFPTRWRARPPSRP